MDRPSFRSHSVLTALLLTALALAVACSSASPAPPPGGTGMGFGDSGTPPKPDATVVKKHKDAGEHDATPKDVTPDTYVVVTDAASAYGDGGTGVTCMAGDQCMSGVCATGSVVVPDGGRRADAGACTAANCACQAPSCTDGVKNGTETGVDCGGTCPNKCVDNVGCLVGSDCVTGVCAGVNGQDGGPGGTCAPPSCTDGVKNGTETDVDCGSSEKCPPGETCQTCPGCTTGEACTTGTDCTSTICTASTCSCPTGMTEVVASPPYCIDMYEVTFAQYNTFLDLGVDPGSQSAECQWNTSFEEEGLGVAPGTVDLANPVTNVNWCDAFAYCAHTGGKHLCGSIATPRTATMPAQAGGLPVQFPVDAAAPTANDPNVDEWYNACSAQGQAPYFYGTSYLGGACNGIDSPAQRKSGPVDDPPGNAGTYIDLKPATPSCIRDACNNPIDQYSTVRAGQTVSCQVGASYVCTPKTCSALSFTCGIQSDGCGGTINCGLGDAGACPGNQTCGGGGTANKCGSSDAGVACTRATCASLGATCGATVGDGCGGVLNCGTACPPAPGEDTNQTCGGLGSTSPNQCGFAIPSTGCGSAFIESTCHNTGNNLFDMSGNVAEWTNSCSGYTSASDPCLTRGGSFDSPNGSASLTCAWSTAQPAVQRNTVAADIGFRCCL